MDYQKRIDELKTEIHRLAEGKEVLGGIENLPPAVAVAFLERVISVEKAERRAAGEPEPPARH
jgi:hypothetical protein